MKLYRNLSLNNLKKAMRYCRKNGISRTFFAAAERLQRGSVNAYQVRELSAEELERQRSCCFAYPVTISLLVPAYETEPTYLKQMITSVIDQTYGNWELIIADAGTTSVVEQTVAKWRDERIVYRRLSENAGIAENSNQALAMASGTYVGLLDHDDLLAPDALFEVAMCLQTATPPVLLYTDEDKVNETLTHYFEPNFKKKFNLDLFLSNNYICHFSVVKAEYMRKVPFRKEYDGAQDYDLFLRLVAKLLQTGEGIAHIDKVLYHWRAHAGSTSENPASKQYAYEAGKRAVQDFANQQGWRTKVSHISHLGFYRMDYAAQGDIFNNRKEVGVIGGAVVAKGKIVGGAMQKDGTGLYDGLPIQFSGYMHRASLQQDVEALDIRNMQVCRELRAMYKAAMEQMDKLETIKAGKHVTKLQEEQAIRKISLWFCEKVREQGYLLLYDPQMQKEETRTSGGTKQQ